MKNPAVYFKISQDSPIAPFSSLKRNALLILFGIPLAVNLVFFGFAYLYGKTFDLENHLTVYISASIIPWLFFKAKHPEKIILSTLSFVFCVVLGIGLLLSTMFLPGSKEHNYLMYKVCFPALKKYYGVGENDPFPPKGGVDKDGNVKWWFQHHECEDNIRAEKGPVFSDNPVDFIPVK